MERGDPRAVTWPTASAPPFSAGAAAGEPCDLAKLSMAAPLLVCVRACLDVLREVEVHSPATNGHKVLFLCVLGLGWFQFDTNGNSVSVEYSLALTDRMGQKTMIHLKNEIGPAGNRRVILYCPYWLVNLTQYSLLFKQGGFSSLFSLIEILIHVVRSRLQIRRTTERSRRAHCQGIFTTRRPKPPGCSARSDRPPGRSTPPTPTPTPPTPTPPNMSVRLSRPTLPLPT